MCFWPFLLPKQPIVPNEEGRESDWRHSFSQSHSQSHNTEATARDVRADVDLANLVVPFRDVRAHPVSRRNLAGGGADGSIAVLGSGPGSRHGGGSGVSILTDPTVISTRTLEESKDVYDLKSISRTEFTRRTGPRRHVSASPKRLPSLHKNMSLQGILTAYRIHAKHGGYGKVKQHAMMLKRKMRRKVLREMWRRVRHDIQTHVLMLSPFSSQPTLIAEMSLRFHIIGIVDGLGGNALQGFVDRQMREGVHAYKSAVYLPLGSAPLETPRLTFANHLIHYKHDRLDAVVSNIMMFMPRERSAYVKWLRQAAGIGDVFGTRGRECVLAILDRIDAPAGHDEDAREATREASRESNGDGNNEPDPDDPTPPRSTSSPE
jgi:hypothetical protein